jgi:serine/threonine protein kinase
LHSAERPGDTIDPGLLNEARALKQLNLNENPHSPILWDAKVEQHLTSCRTIQPRDDIGEDRKHFVTYLLMSLVPGISLKNDTFWTLNQEERRAIRRAFQTALGNLHKTWVVLSDPNPEHLIWTPQRGILQIINYEHALTFNNFGHYRIQDEPHVSRTLPTRDQTWKNQWVADWRLSKDTIGAFSTGTDGSVFPDDAWMEVYKSEVLKEPKMPVKDIKRSIIGTAGSKIELNSEKKEYLEHIGRMQNSTSGCLIM